MEGAPEEGEDAADVAEEVDMIADAIWTTQQGSAAGVVGAGKEEGGALGLGRRGEVLGAQGGRREGKEGWRRWGGGPWTAARAAEGRGAHGWARGGPGLVIPCRELANTTHPRKGG